MRKNFPDAQNFLVGNTDMPTVFSCLWVADPFSSKGLLKGHFLVPTFIIVTFELWIVGGIMC